MKVEFTHEFIKIYKKRFKHTAQMQKKFDNRVKLFSENYQNPQLKDYQLTGKLQGFRSFSITGDIRVIYYINDETVYFVDIGTHNQVYRK